jgi:hypothetical protein
VGGNISLPALEGLRFWPVAAGRDYGLTELRERENTVGVTFVFSEISAEASGCATTPDGVGESERIEICGGA